MIVDIKINEEICSESIEKEMIVFMRKYNREVGGIIGAHQVRIDSFVSDEGILGFDIHEYTPDIKLLNDVLVDWHNKGIVFRGLVHSHLKREELSFGDIHFAEKIIKRNKMESLLMPIYVKTIDKIIWYSVVL